MERNYTIPVNEAFEAAPAEGGCPFCALHEKLRRDEVDLILGASMMEPDIRIRTNEEGFCASHFAMLSEGGKRLPLALMEESHLARTRERLKGGALSGLIKAKAGASALKTVREMNSSCYLCSRIGKNFTAMVETAALLWQEGEPFRKKTEAVPYFCLPHYERFLAAAQERLSGREFGEFFSVVSKIEEEYLEELSGDVSAFCKSFDYRGADEPLTDGQKRAPDRAREFLVGKGQ